jgi:hypothetical protein
MTAISSTPVTKTLNHLAGHFKLEATNHISQLWKTSFLFPKKTLSLAIPTPTCLSANSQQHSSNTPSQCIVEQFPCFLAP